MRCETCHGDGYVAIDREGEFVELLTDDCLATVPCPTCGGCGIASCCDGMVEIE